jgi:hypothetical protein
MIINLTTRESAWESATPAMPNRVVRCQFGDLLVLRCIFMTGAPHLQ